MKTFVLLFLLIQGQAFAGSYDIEPDNSSIEFEFGKATTVDGQILLSDDFEDSKVQVRAKDMPNISFVSSRIEGTKDKFKLTGDLTIRGYTKEVTFQSYSLGVADKLAFIGEAKLGRGVTLSLRILAHGPLRN